MIIKLGDFDIKPYQADFQPVKRTPCVILFPPSNMSWHVILFFLFFIFNIVAYRDSRGAWFLPCLAGYTNPEPFESHAGSYQYIGVALVCICLPWYCSSQVGEGASCL